MIRQRFVHVSFIYFYHIFDIMANRNILIIVITKILCVPEKVNFPPYEYKPWQNT